MKDITDKVERLLLQPVDGSRRAKECLLPECSTVFVPVYGNQDYCRPAHQREGHKLAKEIGTLIVLTGPLYCECVGGVFMNGSKRFK